MNSQEIKDVLTVRDIISQAEDSADLIAMLIAWRDGSTELEPVAAQPEPPKAPAKAAPAKAAAKSRAKPPAPAEDNEPSPDPSEDADF